MKFTLLLSAVVFTLVLAAAAAPVVRPTGTPTTEIIPICQPGIQHINDCPVTGCNHSNSPRRGGDPLLNTQKNRTDAPGTATPRDLSFFADKEEPSSWRSGSDRSSFTNPTDGEGSVAVVKAWLINVQPGGKETCNCQLTSPQDVDVHLALGARRNSSEDDSTTAEFTPFMRANGFPQFTYARALALKGKYVRVTGYVLLDTEHINNPLSRASNWEIHPITKLEWCTMTKAQCDAGTGWRAL